MEQDYSYNSIKRLMEFSAHKRDGWATFFEVKGVRPLQIFYEEMVEDFDGTIRRFLKEVLQIDVRGDLGIRPKLKKQADELSDYFYERFVFDCKQRGEEALLS